MTKTLKEMSSEEATSYFEKFGRRLRAHYRAVTHGDLVNVNICDRFGKPTPAYEIEKPNQEVLGALEIVGLQDYLKDACDFDTVYADYQDTPYRIVKTLRRGDGGIEFIPTFNRSESISDLFSGLTTQERVTILERSDPYLLSLAADNLSCYHQMMLFAKGRSDDFHLNAAAYFPKEILSPELGNEFRNFKLSDGAYGIRRTCDDREIDEITTKFPPLYIKIIREVAGLIGTGYQTGRAVK